MEKKDNLSNLENINIESIGPSTDDLKNRFKAESIPLQTDYSDLIDIADIGRKATGQAPGQTPSQDPTLELDSNDLLIVKIDPDGGLKRSIKGLGIKLTDSDQTKTGLSLTSSGLKVDSGLGIILTEGHGVSIQLTDSNDQTNTGLFLTTDGLRVDPGKGIKLETGHGVSVGEGNGIQVNPDDIAVKPKTNGGISVDADGVSVKVKPNSGINIDTNGISVKPSNGIIVDANGVSVKAKTNSGINIDTNGISVKPSNGIIADANGVSVKAKTNSGISVDADGVAVKCWPKGGIHVTDNEGIYLNLKGGDTHGSSGTSGLELSTEGVAVKCWETGGIEVIDSDGIFLKLEGGNHSNDWSGTSGLSLSSAGVKVKAGNGITVDSNGVSVNVNQIASALANLIIPSGTIVPFYSNGSLPNGWVWCDGNNGTPNLNNYHEKYDSDGYVNIISGFSSITTDHWQLGYGTHLNINTFFMKYIMKK